MAIQSSRSLSKFQPPREAGFGKVLVVLSPILAAGGVITYAKYDEGFRKTLIQTIPGAEPALNYFLEENEIGKKFDEAKDSVIGLFGSSNDTPKKADIIPPPLASE